MRQVHQIPRLHARPCDDSDRTRAWSRSSSPKLMHRLHDGVLRFQSVGGTAQRRRATTSARATGMSSPGRPSVRHRGGVWMVGEAGLEPAISCSQSTCVTRLRYSPPISCVNIAQYPTSLLFWAIGVAAGRTRSFMALILQRSYRTCRSNRTCQEVVAGDNLDRVRSEPAWAKLHGFFFQRDRGSRRGRGEAPGDK